MQQRPWMEFYDEGARIAALADPQPLPTMLDWAAQEFSDAPAIILFQSHDDIRRT